MNRLDREWEIKLDLLASIARSQESLALMLEQAARVATEVEMPPTVLREHIRALAGMQEALLTAAIGTRWRKPRQGCPCSPWLSGKVSVAGKRK